MNNPLISIITSTLNCESTIEDLIISIQKQKERSWEWLVLDCISSDKTIEIINSYNLPNTKVIVEKDQGIYDAWNKGLNLARGSWVIFLGGDDFICDDNVFSDMKYYLSKKNFIVYGNFLSYSKNDDVVVGKSAKNWEEMKSSLDLPIHEFPPCPATFINRDLALDIMFDTNFKIHADALFFYKATSIKEPIYVNRNISYMGNVGLTSGYEGRVKRWIEKYNVYKATKNIHLRDRPSIKFSNVLLSFCKILLSQAKFNLIYFFKKVKY